MCISESRRTYCCTQYYYVHLDHCLCAALLDQSIYFLRSPISPFAQMKFPECFHLSLRIHPNEHICPNFKMYLSKLQNVFVQIAQYICPNCKMYLSKLPNVFVQIAKCICPNCKHFQNFPPVPSYSACCCPTVRGRGVA